MLVSCLRKFTPEKQVLQKKVLYKVIKIEIKKEREKLKGEVV